MSHPPDLIHHGLEQARLALWAVINMTNAHLRPLMLKRSLKQKAMGRLKQLEIIVRRLLTLLALSLTLAPVKPRSPATPGSGDRLADPVCRKAVPGFALTGKLLSGFDPDTSGLFPCTVRASGPVPAAPILARLAALQQVLAAPDAHARRLARALQRQRDRGEARPVALPMTRTHRMVPELGMIATALPGLIRTALESWDNSS
ncbi:hypothetical protein [Hyphomonas johnsonii]|uniref:Uncharacterized protein n=1 Tax=Hyphomonas johnsonii MHS-2 TaxID=1280950 RepID=A0A059FM38_9PROT|nr:hypothetical protein [Hyphomonas johnsonii]KCZ91750.1 hypothetical protein HJO_11552 [Hyphomonas johnsonii MHS-2]